MSDESLEINLSARYRAFVLHYIADPKRNAKAAAIKAGYSEKTAEQQASRLLRNVKVKAAVEEQLKQQEQRLKLDADYCIQRLHQLESIDLTQLLEADGSVKPIDQWPEGYGKIVQGLKITVEEQYSLFENDGNGKPKPMVNKEIKLPERTTALIAMLRHFAGDKLKLTGSLKLEEIVGGGEPGQQPA